MVNESVPDCLVTGYEPLIEDRAYVGGAAISTGTVVSTEGELPPFREPK